MTTEREPIEYPDRAGYPDGKGFLDEGTEADDGPQAPPLDDLEEFAMSDAEDDESNL
ncbi:hypothetical protein [Leifsonia sp. NPDC058230]|uniref:hypothetical protein n=1 Tax=Leifsonia sp. NPDC058230 TaxID=3346391 RepID=UPI0036DBE252